MFMSSGFYYRLRYTIFDILEPIEECSPLFLIMDSSTESEEDEELKQAIALSLQHQSTVPSSGSSNKMESTSKTAKQVIDLTSDEDSVSITTRKFQSAAPDAVLPSNGLGMLGLDRKAMEVERLARKRKPSASLPSRSPLQKLMKMDSQYTSEVSRLNVASLTRNVKSSTSIEQSQEVKHKDLKYAQGIVLKTWCYGFPRDGDIKVEEVLERDDLTLAVLSSFQWDVEWILGKINTTSTKLVFVMQAKEESTKRQYEQETADMPNLRLCFPSMEGQVNCMHSKLMLLAHPTHLRIVVPTANLVPYDWGETGVMENMAFLIDLPRLEGNETTSANSMTFFGTDLLYFLQAMGLQQEIIQSIYKFDFSSTKDFAFVHTIGGTHTGEGEPWRRTGYCGFGRAVKELGLSTNEDIYIDFVASSIGAVNQDFLAMLYLAAQGDDGLREYEWRTSTAAKLKGSKKGSRSAVESHKPPDGFMESLQMKLRVFFPSQETVVRSRGGVGCGGPICFSSKWFNAATFPKKVLRDCKSVREGVLMHNKVNHEELGLVVYLLVANLSV